MTSKRIGKYVVNAYVPDDATSWSIGIKWDGRYLVIGLWRLIFWIRRDSK